MAAGGMPDSGGPTGEEEMVDLRQPADKSNQNKLPVIWHAYASGLLYGNSHFNMQLTLNAVNQAFAQSPYLSNKQ